MCLALKRGTRHVFATLYIVKVLCTRTPRLQRGSDSPSRAQPADVAVGQWPAAMGQCAQVDGHGRPKALANLPKLSISPRAMAGVQSDRTVVFLHPALSSACPLEAGRIAMPSGHVGSATRPRHRRPIGQALKRRWAGTPLGMQPWSSGRSRHILA